MTPLDPDTDRWLWRGLPVHATGCITNTGSDCYGSEPAWQHLCVAPRQASRGDCGAASASITAVTAASQPASDANSNQLPCPCHTTTLELVR